MRAALAVVLWLAFCTAARAQPGIRPFPLATVQQLGAAIYRQDRAAWVATDALRVKTRDFAAERLIGWIVVDDGEGQKVRFLRDLGSGPEVAYDVDVSPAFQTTLSAPADRKLSLEELSMFAARATAMKELAQAEVCRAGYNTVVLRDPERGGWLVWALAPMVKPGALPVGIHYRFTVSADGRTVSQRDALARGCGDLDTSQVPSSTQAMGVTHLVSPEPVETQVFLQLQYGKPFYVMTKDGVWVINGGKIRQVDPKPKSDPR